MWAAALDSRENDGRVPAASDCMRIAPTQLAPESGLTSGRSSSIMPCNELGSSADGSTITCALTGTVISVAPYAMHRMDPTNGLPASRA
eukprot:scaffold6910_cov136-Isochrysis_galbana.AAC.1